MKKIIALFMPLILFAGLLVGCDSSPQVTSYKLDFMVDGAVYYTVQTPGNTEVTMPKDPTKESYDFDGWYWDNGTWQNQFVANSLVTSPITRDSSVYAKWLEIVQPLINVVTFEKDGQGHYNHTFANSVAMLNLAEYISSGEDVSWVVATDAEIQNIIEDKVLNLPVGRSTFYVKATSPDDTKVYTFNIKRNALFTVTFDADGGTTVNPMSVEEGGFITAPTSSKAGYTLKGWGYNFDLPVTSDLNLKAVWDAIDYNISYNLNGGVLTNNNPATYNVESDDFTLVNPTKNGYTFLGWIGGGNGLVIDEPTKDLTIEVANYGDLSFEAVYSLNQYSISYDLDGGSYVSGNNPTEYNIESDDIVIVNPVKEGYTFVGWTGGDIITPSTNVTIPSGSTNDISLKANWTPTNYTITYDLDGGSLDGDNPVTYNVETNDFTLVNPTKNGYTFLGWIGGGNGLVIDEPTLNVTVDVNNYGQLSFEAVYQVINYGISYDLEGGSASNPTSYNIESDDIVIINPTKPGYTFLGWTGGDILTPTKNLRIPSGSTGDLNLKANWELTTYSISYNLDGGSASNPTSYTILSNNITLNNPTRDDYIFLGWTGTGLVEKTMTVTIPTGSTGNRSYTANWKYDGYDIIYTLNGGTNSSNNPLHFKESSPTIVLEDASRTGYNFEGWYTNNLFEGEAVTSIPSGTNHDVNLYAKWTPITYYIEFNENGGTGYMADLEMTYGQANNLTLNTFTKYGYEFLGWSSNASATAATYEDGQSVNNLLSTDGGTKVLYAVWRGVACNISLDNGAGSSSVTSVNVRYGQNMPAVAIPTAPYGYVFAGYYDNNGVQYYDAGGHSLKAWDKVSNVTLYAFYTAKTSTISFDNGDGTGGSSSTSATYDSGMPRAIAPSAPYGYVFAGYFSDDDVQYYDASMNSVRNWDQIESITLYAHYIPKTVNLYFVTASGSVVGGYQATYGEDLPEIDVPITQTGYTFLGFKDNNGIYYYDEQLNGLKKWDKVSDTYLYSSYEGNTYEVVLDFNYDGSHDDVEFDVTFGSEMPTGFDFGIPTREEYVFLGFADSNEVYYYGPTMNSVRAWDKAVDGTVLYAQWAINKFTVSFSLGGATGRQEPIEVYNGQPLPTLTVIPTYAGYTFIGYFDADNVQYYDTDLVGVRNYDKSSDTTLYAHFEPLTFTVTLDAGAGSGGTTSVTARYGSHLPRGAVAPTAPEGYYFIGYYTSGNDRYYDETMESTQSYTLLEDITLYAKYEKLYSYITLNKQGGGSDYSFYVDYGDELPSSLIVPTRSGYTFLGYFDADDVQYYTAAMVGTKTWDKSARYVTLYAHWDLAKYTVTFNFNGGTGEQDAIEVTYLTELPELTSSIPTKTNYTFIGYYDEDGTQYYDAELNGVKDWDKAKNDVLYAHYRGNPFTITFDKGDGEGGSDNVIAHYDEELPEALAPSLIGHNFIGYYNEENVKYYDANMESVRDLDTPNDLTLYAHYEVATYNIILSSDGSTKPPFVTLSFDLNGGTGEIAPQIIDTENGMVYPSIPRRDNYTFAGWYTSTEFDELFDFSTPISSDTTVYAKWNGPMATATTVVVPGQNTIYIVGGADNYFTFTALKSGSVTINVGKNAWIGISTTRSESGNVYNSITSTLTAGVQYYIHIESYKNKTDSSYVGNTYLDFVTNYLPGDGGLYDSNGTALASTAQYHQPFTFPVPTRTGYDFLGWFSESEGGTQYTDSLGNSLFNYDKAEDCILYAHWDVHISTITFDHGEGSSDVTSIEVAYGDELPALEAPVLEHYDFIGYFDDENVQYYDENMVALKAWDKDVDSTLHARYYPKSYVVTFDKGEGKGGSDSVNATYTLEMPVATAPTLYGHTFVGYFDEDGVQYYDGDMVGVIAWDKPADTTLYAHYEVGTYIITLSGTGSRAEGRYTVTFELNGGTGDIPPQTVTPEQNIVYPTNPTKDGYVFAGWYLDEDLENKYTFSGIINESFTLYAKYENVAITQQTSFTRNGSDYTSTNKYSSSSTATITFTPTVDVYVSFRYRVSSESGYDFFTCLNGGTQVFRVSGSGSTSTITNLLVKANTLLTFKYSKDSSVNSGDDCGYIFGLTFTSKESYVPSTEVVDMIVPDETISLTYGQSFSIDVIPTIEGKSFTGWCDEEGTLYTNASGEGLRNWNKGEDTTLYPSWNINSYTITFDSNGGSEVESITDHYGALLEMPENPTLYGKTFVGWFDATLENEFTSTTMPGRDVTLYAKWIDYAINASYNDIEEIDIDTEINNDLFALELVDTDGNPVVGHVEIVSGEKVAGGTISVKLSGTGLYETEWTVTIENIKVYGDPIITYNETIDYYSQRLTLEPSLFEASATDSFGNPLTTYIRIKEDDPDVGTLITIVLSATDHMGHNTVLEIPNVKYYGNPNLTYNTDIDEGVKVTDVISVEFVGAVATDSFGEPAECSVNYEGSMTRGNRITINIAAVDSKGNSSSYSVRVYVYEAPIIDNPTKTNFGVDDVINVSNLGLTIYDDCGYYISSDNVTLELVSGTKEAGHVMTYKVTATDKVGNVAEKTFDVKIYGTPTITFDETVDKVTTKYSLGDPSLYGATAYDSFGEELTVSVLQYSGSIDPGHTVRFSLRATDAAYNTVSIVTGDIKVYSSSVISITYDTDVNEIKATSHGEEFNATAVTTFGDTCDVDILIANGTLTGGTTVDLYITATDILGDVAQTSLIKGVRVYSTPTISYIREGNFIYNGDNPTDYFVIKDSFGNVLDYEINVESGSMSESTITYRLSAVDQVGNILNDTYSLYVLVNDKSIIELYDGDNLIDVVTVYKGENYVLYSEAVETNKWYYDTTLLTDENGNSLSAWDKDAGVYRVYLTNQLIHYSIIYVLNGGANNTNPTSYTSTDAFTLIPLDRNENGHFVGWFRDPLFTNQIEGVTLGTTGNLVLYAKFEAHTIDENCVCSVCHGVYHHYVDHVCTVCGAVETSIWDGTVATSYARGSGTIADPYIISTGSELALLAKNTNDRVTSSGLYYKLSNDIDLNHLSWTPIGYADNESSSLIKFCGTFDGDGHIIKNVNITETNSKAIVGLFGLTSGATIKNLALKDIVYDIKYTATGVAYVGGLIGFASNTNITNILVNGTIYTRQTASTKVTYLGSIAGALSSTTSVKYCVVNCSLRNEVTASSGYNAYTGGIAGTASDTNIQYCFSNSTITSKSSNGRGYGAGFVGVISNGNTVSMTDNAAKSVFSVDSDGYYGPFYIPWNNTTASLTRCYYSYTSSAGTYKGNGSYVDASCLSDQEWYVGTLQGWDFSTTWIMKDGYPTLKMFE